MRDLHVYPSRCANTRRPSRVREGTRGKQVSGHASKQERGKHTWKGEKSRQTKLYANNAEADGMKHARPCERAKERNGGIWRRGSGRVAHARLKDSI